MHRSPLAGFEVAGDPLHLHDAGLGLGRDGRWRRTPAVGRNGPIRWRRIGKRIDFGSRPDDGGQERRVLRCEIDHQNRFRNGDLGVGNRKVSPTFDLATAATGRLCRLFDSRRIFGLLLRTTSVRGRGLGGRLGRRTALACTEPCRAEHRRNALAGHPPKNEECQHQSRQLRSLAPHAIHSNTLRRK